MKISYFKKINKKYIFVAVFIIVAIFAGIFFDLTKLTIFFKVISSGNTYTGYSLQEPDSLVMLPAWRDILDGHWWSSDGMTYEYANAPFLWMNPPNNLLLLPLILLLPSVDYLYVVGYFFVGMLVFIGFFLTLNLIVKNRIYSMVGSFLLVASNNIFYIVFPITWEQIKLTIRTFTFLGSPPLPILGNRYESLSVLPGLIPFTFTFLFIYLAIIKNKKIWIFLSGIFSGVLLYLYPTSAMYIWMSLGLMMLGFIFIKNYQLAKRIFWIILIAISLSFFHWFNFLSLKSLPWADDIFLIMGGEYGYTPRLEWHLLEYLFYIIFAVLIWKLAKRRGEIKNAIFLIAFLIAPIFLLNIQVISGFSPYGHAWYVHQFYHGFALAFLVSFYWLYQNIKQENKKKPFLILGIILSLILIFRVIDANLYSANKFYRGHVIDNNLKSSFEWLNNNTEIDDVVVSPSYTTNAYLSIFTHNRVVISNPITFVGSLNEILDRWMLVYSLYKIKPEAFKQISLEQKGFIYNNYFRDHRINSWLKRDPEFDKESEKKLLTAIDELVINYENYPKRLEYLLTKYKMDYFYIGPSELEIMDNAVNFDSYEWLYKVYDKDGIMIYKILYDKINSEIKI